MFIKIHPPTYLFIALILMVIAHFFLPSARLIVFPWTLIGALPLAAGILLNLIADKLLKECRTTVKPNENPTAMITGSVYRVCRHPMYLGMLLILLGLGILLGTLTPFAVVILFTIAMETVFIRHEEQVMADVFKDEWTDYRNKVRRWI
ncbi:isoprenylcysteine carboxylmethyltransferase family protein [bacterium]|nr:isoprenylcysteine carboxylmethyltransferase family protein [candidate division CSSED10-310 bacterium]